MGLLDNVTSGVSSEASEVLGKSKQSAANSSFNRDFNQSDFDDDWGEDVTADAWTRLSEFTVPASTRYAWGYGSAKNPENQGYIYVLIQNGTPEEVTGTLRLAQESPTGRKTLVVADFDSSTLHGSKSDRTQRIPLPEQVDKPQVSKDSKLVVEFNANSTDTIDPANTEVILPVTEYDLS